MKNILVVRQHNQIGDMLCSLTLYKALKKKYPDSLITLVAAKTNYEIPFFDLNPYLDRVLVFEKSNFRTIIKFIFNLRKVKYQIGIVPSTIVLSRTSHIINFISGAKKRVGVKSIDGEENISQRYLNIKADFKWKSKHQLNRNLEVANQIDCNLNKEEIEAIKITYSEKEFDFAKNFFNQNFLDKTKKIVAFHPGAGKEDNRWSEQNFIELIKSIYEKYNCYILLTSGYTDEKVINDILDKLNESKIKYVQMHNYPAKKLGAILTLVDLYITNDTGTMHIAGFSGVNMISLFGPTDPLEWGHFAENQKHIKADNINDISVDRVLEIADNFLVKDKKKLCG